MRTTTSILFFALLLIFTGCSEKKISEMDKSECESSGNKWLIKKRFNYLTGEQEKEGKCVKRHKQ
jgi:hypothetical protein